MLLGQVKRLSFVLEIAAVAETVRVSASSPLVDTRQSARVFSLRQDTIDLLPKGRDFTSLVSEAPGANQEPKLGGISIDGSSASENRFVINGIETTNLFTGVSGHAVLPEFVDEIQVKSSGYTAEYGGSTGGVINVVTKSGTNTWRGDVLVNFEGDALDGGRRQTLRRVPTDSTRAEYVTYPEDTYRRVEPGFAIGGPIKRDRAWMFAAYQPALTHTERTVTFTFDDSTATKASDQTGPFLQHQPDDAGARHPAHARDVRLESVATGRRAAGPRWRHLSPGQLRHHRQATELHGVRQRRLGGDRKLYVGTRAGYFTNNHTTGNVMEQPLFVFVRTEHRISGRARPRFSRSADSRPICRTTSAVSTGCRASTRRSTRRTSAAWPGQHTLKAGLQFDRRSNDVDKGRAPTGSTCSGTPRSAGQRGRYGYYRVLSNPIDPKRGQITFGNVERHDRRPVRAGCVDGRQPADGQPRPADRERDGAVLQRGQECRDRADPLLVRRQAGAAGWGRVGRHG